MQVGMFIAAFLSVCYCVKLTYPDVVAYPREFEGGLEKELGGSGAVKVHLPFFPPENCQIWSKTVLTISDRHGHPAIQNPSRIMSMWTRQAGLVQFARAFRHENRGMEYIQAESAVLCSCA